jgi:hypothetical protein
MKNLLFSLLTLFSCSQDKKWQEGKLYFADCSSRQLTDEEKKNGVKGSGVLYNSVPVTNNDTSRDVIHNELKNNDTLYLSVFLRCTGSGGVDFESLITCDILKWKTKTEILENIVKDNYIVPNITLDSVLYFKTNTDRIENESRCDSIMEYFIEKHHRTNQRHYKTSPSPTTKSAR